MLRDGEPNPLNIHGTRQIEGTCPPHFTQVTFDLYVHQTHKEFTDWIWENLEGRFWFGDIYTTDNIHVRLNNTVYGPGLRQEIHMYVCAAFELPSEATMFAMCRDQISIPNRL